MSLALHATRILFLKALLSKVIREAAIGRNVLLQLPALKRTVRL
jgi:hypothetical protein